MLRSAVALLAGVGLSVVAMADGNEELMSKSGCVACHRVDTKLIGPSYKDVAARYRGDAAAPETLFAKVREGGEGVWGDMPMVPNGPNKISDADLQTLIAWILSLK